MTDKEKLIQLQVDANALMVKVVELLKRDNVPHEVALNALANLAYKAARHNECCTFMGGMLLTQMGSSLMSVAAGRAQQPATHPTSQHFH